MASVPLTDSNCISGASLQNPVYAARLLIYPLNFGLESYCILPVMGLKTHLSHDETLFLIDIRKSNAPEIPTKSFC